MAQTNILRSVEDIANDVSAGTPNETNDSEFSQANVFGLFVALSLCLLVQPYGSLLYTKPRSIPGRVLFFFWRLNPLACAAEVILFTIAGVYGLRQALKSWHTGSRDTWGFVAQVRLTAEAVQILRGHGAVPLHWRALWHGLPGDEEAASPVPMSHEVGSSEFSRNLLVDLPHPLAGMRREEGVESTRYTDAERDTTPALPALVANPIDGGMNGGPPARLPAGIGSTTTVPTPTSIDENVENPPLAEPSVGIRRRGTLQRIAGKGEIIIEVVGTISVLVVLVKLASITIPLHIRLPAWFMVAGWAAVQVLVAASHGRTLGLDDPERLLQRVIRLEGLLSHLLTWLCITFLGGFALAHVVTSILFKSGPLPHQMKWAFYNIAFAFFILVDPIVYKYIPNMLSCLGRRPRGQICLQQAPSLCVKRPVAGMDLLIISVFYLVKMCVMYALGFWWGFCTTVCVFHPDRCTQGMAVWSTILWTLLFCLWFLGPGVSFSGRDGDREWVQSVFLFFNLLTAVFVFTGAMMMYDSSGTYKPDWVEWLGRLSRMRRGS